MGSAHRRPSSTGLLRQRAARRDVRGFARPMRRLLRHHWRPGLRLGRCGRYLEGDRARSAGRPFGRSPDARMIRVALPFHLRKLARIEGEVELESDGTDHATRHPGRTRGALSGSARHDPRPRHAKAPRFRALLRLRTGSLPRPTRHSPSRSRRHRGRDLHRYGRDGRRLGISPQLGFGSTESRPTTSRRVVLPHLPNVGDQIVYWCRSASIGSILDARNAGI